MPKQINAKLYRLAKTQTDIDMQTQWRDMLTQVADSGALLIDGANIAADTIYGRSIVAESITADKIKAGSITAEHITSGGITADVLTGGSLQSIAPLAEGGSLLNLNTGDFNLAGGNLTWNNTTKVLTLNASQIIIGEKEVATKEDIEQIELTPGPKGDPGETGEPGESGEPGEPGVSAYLHTAWSNSTNSQTGFSTSVSTDKLYMGTYSSSSPTPSEVYTSYKWIRVKGLDAKFYSVIVDKSFLNRNGLSSTATETIAINSYVHEGNSAGVAAPGFFIIKEQIKQTTGGVTTYVFQEKHRSTAAVSQLNYTVSASAVTVKIEFYLTNQFNNLFAVRDIGVLMDASTDIEARVPIAQLIENINNHPDTTRISGKRMHFTNEVSFDQSFHTKLFAETGFIENLGAYEFSADNIKTGTLSSANGISTMNLTTGAFSFAGGKLKYDGTTLSVIGSLTVDSFAPALKTSFDGKLDTTKLATSGQVSIHGGNITAGTLTADKITTGTLDASKVTVTNLNATNITAGTLDVGKLTLQNLSANDIKTGTLDAGLVTVKNLNATNITAGTLDVGILNLKNLSADDMQQGTLDANNVSIVNLSASTIKTGTLDANLVSIDNLSANYIKGGRLDLSQGLTISDGVNDILSIGVDGKVALNASSIKIGILPVATKEDVDNIALTPGPQGTSITSVTEWYLATSAATGVTTSTAGWDKTMRTMTTTNKYLWNYKVINYSEGKPQTTTPVIIGVYGTTGATGRSINSVTKHYLATSESSGIMRTNSSFTQTIQSTTPTNKYLWTYETITWNVAPLTTYVEPFIIGTHGEKGEIGTTGVGLQSITEWYLATPLKEGVTRTTSGWKNSVQTLSSVNNYLWNYEQVNYDNGTKHYTDPTIIGTFGEQGISVKGVTEYYLASPLSEGITKDTPGWTTDIQLLTPENKYLWNKEVVHYSDDVTFLDKTDVLSGTEIFTDKADGEAVVHVEIDGKSYQEPSVALKNIAPKKAQKLFGLELTSTSDNIDTFLVTNSSGSSPRITTTFEEPLSVGDVVYLSHYHMVPPGSGYRPIVMSGGDKNQNAINILPITSQPEKTSLIFTSTANNYIMHQYISGGDTLGQTAKMGELLVINLTKSFGKGNEPVLEQMDQLIELNGWFDEEAVLKTGNIQLPKLNTPSPDYPIEIHNLNDFDVVSSVGKENLLSNSHFNGSDLNGWNSVYGPHVNINSLSIKTFTVDGGSTRIQKDFELNEVGEFTFSIYAKTDEISSTHNRIEWRGFEGLNAVAKNENFVDGYGVYSITFTNETPGKKIIRGYIPNVTTGSKMYIEWEKLERGNVSTSWNPSVKDVSLDSYTYSLYKINLLLDEPLRSVGDIKDRLFRDSDGLWKIERNVGESTINRTIGAGWAKGLNSNPDFAYFYTSQLSLGISRKNSYDSPLSFNRFEFIGKGAYQSRVREGVVSWMDSTPFIFIIRKDRIGEVTDLNISRWMIDNPVTFQYELATPIIEILTQSLQDKLNNLRTFKDSNYIYTVLPDKSNILQDNLGPTLHATFKSKAWAGNFAGQPSIIGVYGDSAKLLYLSTSADSMTFNSDGSANPASQTITFTGNLQNVLGNVLFTAIAYNGTTVVSTISLSGVGNTRTLTQAQFPSSADRIQVKATLGNLEDTVTIVKLKNGADAIVGYLTNESVTLSANNAGTVSSFGSTSGTFKVFEGTIDKTTTAASTFRVKSQTGAVGAITSSGTYSVSSMSSDTANIVFEATYKNVKIDQTLSLSKSKEGTIGPQGISITKVDVEYYLHTSATATPPTTGWSTTAPPWVDGRYMWSRTVTTYSSGEPTISTPVCITGAKGSTGGTGSTGATGRGVSSIVEQFYLSDSKTTQTGGSWSTTMPTWSPGKYVWTRSLITYTTGTPATSTTEPLVSSEWEAINEIEVGGRNLLISSTLGRLKESMTHTTTKKLKGYGAYYFNFVFELEPNTTYTVSNKKILNDSTAYPNALSVLIYDRVAATTRQTVGTMQSGKSITFTTNATIESTDQVYFYISGTTTANFEIDELQLEKGNRATDWTPAPEDVQKEIGDVLDVTNTLKNFTDTAFVDGVIERAEAQAIKEHLNILKKENNDLLNQYSTLYTNVNLIDPAKDALLTARNNYATSYTSLVSVINTAISGDRTTAAQKTAVDNGFISYTNSLQAFTQKLSEAQTAIGTKVSSDAVDAIEIGGRNLVLNSNLYTGSFGAWTNNGGATVQVLDGKNVVKLGASGNGIYQLPTASEAGTYTYSFLAKSDVAGVNARVGFLNYSNKLFPLTTTWKRYSYTQPISANQLFHIYVTGANQQYYITDIQVEKGNKATDWSPAPEDVAASVKAAQDKANAASLEATAAQADATVGKNMADNLSNDSIITQVEKLELKREWDAIVKEKPSITIQATDYVLQDSTEATAYNTAYTALNNSIPSLLANMNVTSGVARTTFNNNFANYYDKRQLLLNRIAKKAKELADVAQSSVDNLEIGTVNLIIRSREEIGKNVHTDGNIGNSTHNSLAPNISVIAGKNYTFTKTSSGIAEDFFRYGWYNNSGSFISRGAQSANIFTTQAPVGASILKVSYPTISQVKVEEGNKSTAWSASPEDIEASYTAVAQAKAEAERVKAETYADGKVTAEEAARIADANAKLAAAKKHAEDQILADKTIKDTRATNETPAWYYVNYPKQTIREFKQITTMGLSVSGHTYGVLTTEVTWASSSGGPVKQSFTVLNTTYKRSGTSTTWTPWVNYDEIAETAKSDAATAKGIADGAASSASAANSLLTDIASDSKLTATEKKAAKKEWDIIVGEKPKIDTSADTYGITTQKTAYNTAYNALNTYLSSLLANLNTTSNIVGTTFRANFRGYYNARQDLLNAISDGAKALVDNIEIGGTNLLQNSRTVSISSNNTSTYPTSVTAMEEDNRNFSRIKRTDLTLSPTTFSIYSTIPITNINKSIFDNELTVVSFKARASQNVTMSMMNATYGGSPIVTGDLGSINVTTEWKTFYSIFTKIPKSASGFRVNPTANTTSVTMSTFYLDLCEWKIEKGNKPTDWSLAPEDVKSDVDSKADSKETAEQIEQARKDLIDSQEKEVAELKAQIKTLDAQRASLETARQNDMNAVATQFVSALGRVSAVETNLGDQSADWNFINTNIKMSDEGLMIGDAQKGNYLLQQSNRLDFISNGTVVAYVSNNELWIESGVFTDKLTIGGIAIRKNGADRIRFE